MNDYRSPFYKKRVGLSASALDLFIERTKDFIQDSQAKLEEYTAFLRECQEHEPELNPQEDSYMKDLREALCQAEQLVYEVEQLRKEVSLY